MDNTVDAVDNDDDAAAAATVRQLLSQPEVTSDAALTILTLSLISRAGRGVISGTSGTPTAEGNLATHYMTPQEAAQWGYGWVPPEQSRAAWDAVRCRVANSPQDHT